MAVLGQLLREQSFLGACCLLVFEIAKQEYALENSDPQNFCEQLFALNKKKGDGNL